MRRTRTVLTLFSVLFWCLPVVRAQQASPIIGKLVGEVADAFEVAPVPRALVFVRGWGGVGDRVLELSAKGGFELPPRSRTLRCIRRSSGLCASVQEGRNSVWPICRT
jgi:hypothetical protein